MKKIYIGTVLVISFCSLSTLVFAGQKEQCENSPIQNQYWDPVKSGGSCRCIEPYMRDEETYKCITKAEYEKKHTYTPSNSKESKKPVAEVEIKKETSTKQEALPKIDIFALSADNYSDISSNGEISLGSGKEYLNSIKEGSTDAVYLKNLKAWEQKVLEAEEKSKFKTGADKATFNLKTEEEKNIKSQIAEAEKLLGFTHTRILESTKTFKFEHQSAEYKAYWKQPVDNNPADDTTGATAFNAVSRNVSGYYSQISDLKNKLQTNYPAGWKTEYLDVPTKPARENKKVGDIFNH